MQGAHFAQSLQSRLLTIVHRVLEEGLADADAGAVGEHAGGNVHRGQLLEEQLGCVWDVNLRDLGLVSAWSALKGLGVQLTVMCQHYSFYRLFITTVSTYAIGVIRPQISQTCTLNASETSNNLSFKKAEAP